MGQNKKKDETKHVPCNTKQQAAFSQHALDPNELQLLTTDDTRRGGMQCGEKVDMESVCCVFMTTRSQRE